MREFFPRLPHHVWGAIGPNNGGAERGDLFGERAGAAADVKNALAGLHFEQVHQAGGHFVDEGMFVVVKSCVPLGSFAHSIRSLPVVTWCWSPAAAASNTYRTRPARASARPLDAVAPESRAAPWDIRRIPPALRNASSRDKVPGSDRAGRRCRSGLEESA